MPQAPNQTNQQQHSSLWSNFLGGVNKGQNTVDGGINTVPPVAQYFQNNLQGQAKVTALGTAPYENNGTRSPNNRRILSQTTPIGTQSTPTAPSPLKPNPLQFLGQQQATSQPKSSQQNIPQPTFPQNNNQPQQRTDATQAGFQMGQQGLNATGMYAQDATQFILQQYDRKMADTKFQELQATHGVTGVQEAIDDINKVKEAVQQGAFDPQSISQLTGISAQRVDEVMQGKAFKSIQLPDHMTEELRQEFDFKKRDLQVGYDRSMEQFDITKERAQTEYNRAMDDMIRQAGLDIGQARFMGAVTGMGRSDGFVQAVELMRTQANENLDKLTTRFDRQNEDISRARLQLIEDFEHNMTKMKYYFDKGMDEMRGQTLMQVQAINNKYGVNTKEMTDALQSLYLDVERMRLDHINQTMQLQTSYNKMFTSEIDNLRQYQMQAQQLEYQQQNMQNSQMESYLATAKEYGSGVANNLYPEIASQATGQVSAVDFIKQKEGFRANAYQDSAGVRTIGYGTTKINGIPVKPGDTITEAQASQLMQEQLKGYQTRRSFINVPLSQSQETALTSFEYNLGSGIWQKNAMPIIEALNNGNIDGAIAHLNKYVYAGGKRIQGLANRRGEEAELLKKAQEEILGIPDATNGGVSAEVQSYADAIMSPTSTLTLDQLPSDIRGQVGPYLAYLQQEAYRTGDTVGMMRASAGGAKLEAEGVKSLNKAFTVVNQLGTLEGLLTQKNPDFKDAKTGELLDLSPMTGWLRKKNPWDTNAQEIQAILTSMTPMLARGIYGEVGVLTDNDIRLYQQTIPNLKQTDDVKKAVMALTLRTVRNSIKDTLEINAGAGRDVSGLTDKYLSLEASIKQIDQSIGIADPDDDVMNQIIENPDTFDSQGDAVDIYLNDLIGDENE